MNYKRVLTIQDISCVGQCSLTVALPILSACGQETCVLPSAVLSTHTGGFSGFTFRDLTEDMPAIRQHWEKEGIRFDAVYTGYLGSTKQIGYVKEIMEKTGKPGSLNLVDPAMADNGKLYVGFDQPFVEAMKGLCALADVILPNITEACLLTDTPYETDYDEAYVDGLLQKLLALGAKTIILTGVGYRKDQIGVVVCSAGKKEYYEHKKIAKSSHGTGDIFASAFVGAYLGGKSLYDAARIAADFTVCSIEQTLDDASHWYGVKFERAIPELIAALGA